MLCYVMDGLLADTSISMLLSKMTIIMIIITPFYIYSLYILVNENEQEGVFYFSSYERNSIREDYSTVQLQNRTDDNETKENEKYS